MKIKEIHVEAKFVKNLGNYQSFSPTAGVTITLESGDDEEEVYEKAWNLVGDQVEEQLKLFEESLRATKR